MHPALRLLAKKIIPPLSYSTRIGDRSKYMSLRVITKQSLAKGELYFFNRKTLVIKKSFDNSLIYCIIISNIIIIDAS